MYSPSCPSRPTGRPFTPEERETLTCVSPLSVQRKIVSATRNRVCHGKRTWAADLKADLENIGRDILNSWDPECDPVELLEIGMDFVLSNDRTLANYTYLAQHLADTPVPWEYQERVDNLRKIGWSIRACDYNGNTIYGHMPLLQVRSVSWIETSEESIQANKVDVPEIYFPDTTTEEVV